MPIVRRFEKRNLVRVVSSVPPADQVRGHLKLPFICESILAK